MYVLSFSYGIKMDHAINAPGHGNIVIDGLNATVEIIGKLASNDTSNIGFLPSASKDVSVTFLDQFIRIFDRI